MNVSLSMLFRVLAACLLLTIPLAASADDVVFSAARVVERNGAHVRAESAHLYRSSSNGSKYRQLTSGPMDDIQPCLTPDGTRILFWRRDRQDLIGRSWLCSIRPDGSDLHVIRVRRKSDLGSPREAYAPIKRIDDMQLHGIPSNEGGTAVPTNISVLQDGTYVFGYYDTQSLLGMADSSGKHIRRFSVYKSIRGKKLGAAVFGDDQWSLNSNGGKAFWLGYDKKQLLLQRVLRTEEGGLPTLFFIDADTGQITRSVGSQFLEDLDKGQTSFLTTTWKWGAGFGTDGAVPLQTLSIWESKRRPRKLGPPGMTCLGACFLRTSLSFPTHPNSTLGVPRPKRKAPTHDIIFAAEVFGENLGNVYTASYSHLYRIHPDGTGLRQLTQGDYYDYLPTLDQGGKRILFWRSPAGWEGPYRLYSMALDGSSLRSLKVKVGGYPQPGLAKALLVNRRLSASYGKNGGDLMLFLPKRNLIFSQPESILFSPDAHHGIIRRPEGNVIIDLSTGKKTKLATRWLLPAWIDDHTVVAFRAEGFEEGGSPTPGRVALLDLSGRPRTQLDVVFGLNQGDSVLPNGFSTDGKAFRLWDQKAFLWVAHHSMSDGGYDFIHRINLHQSHITFVAEQSVEAISPNGRSFLGTRYDWVGGYKGTGADKLATMYVWDAKTLKKTAIGFRRMICNGACFVPAR